MVSGTDIKSEQHRIAQVHMIMSQDTSYLQQCSTQNYQGTASQLPQRCADHDRWLTIIHISLGIDIGNPLLPPRVGLHVTRNIGIEEQVDWLLSAVRIPMHRRAPDTRVRVQVVDERSPHTRHQLGKLLVRLWRALERFSVMIAHPLDVVENKRHLLEVRGAHDEGNVCGVDVESVAVRRR